MLGFPGNQMFPRSPQREVDSVVASSHPYTISGVARIVSWKILNRFREWNIGSDDFGEISYCLNQVVLKRFCTGEPNFFGETLAF